MRLFIAVNFTEDIKEKAMLVINCMKTESSRGNFTRRENLHLTLAFLGEVKENKIPQIKAVMDKLSEKEFTLEIGDMGKFGKGENSVYWIGINKSELLERIYKKLRDSLTQLGFSLDDKEFTPHLTVGRQIILNEDFNYAEFKKSVPKMTANVGKISLMKSERVFGKLKYTEIYSKLLNK